MDPRDRMLMGSAAPAAWVFITDPDRSPVPVHLQRAFGLSAAETRTYLRRLFAKTAITRQADLIRVLLGAR